LDAGHIQPLRPEPGFRLSRLKDLAEAQGRMITHRLPLLDELGNDLLQVSKWRRAVSLISPFVLAALFFVFGGRGWGGLMLACAVLLSFFTYGSISHDLVHRTLKLPAWLNEALLTMIELLAFRSGHAYRVTHLHHHARFPAEDDLEARCALLPLHRALFDGITLQPRLWLLALKKRGSHHRWVVFEGLAVVTLLVAAMLVWPWTPLPAIYAALMIAGSWVFPLATVIIPHDAHGTDALTQTRLFRGRVLSYLALEHLYHLEHHLYPQVPHHNWRRLAERLDPHFAKLGLRPIKLLF
jgi:beta-carotene hydroxylase